MILAGLAFHYIKENLISYIHDLYKVTQGSVKRLLLALDCWDLILASKIALQIVHGLKVNRLPNFTILNAFLIIF